MTTPKMAGMTPKMTGMTPKVTGMTPKMTGMTPKMTGMTPGSHGNGSFEFSPALLSQSPAALFGKHRSPNPSGAFSSPSVIAMGMGLASSGDMGMNVSHIPPGPPDESKKRELAEILRLLESRPGRISQLAVERLARSMGLECYKDTALNGVIPLSLGAKIFLLDIDFVGDRVERTALSFEKTLGLSADLAAEIFNRNLTTTMTPSTKPLLTQPLLPFAENLHRLANTDRLSSVSLNCFTAITGVYESLQRIYEYERQHMGGETIALCYGNGRPRMHASDKVGLSVDYWQTARSTPGNKTGMWRVVVEVQEAPTDFGGLQSITPVRASNHWVSDEVKKPREDNLFDMDELVTDWLEPPLEELMDASGDPSQSRPPQARFLMRLDPPVVVPYFDDIPVEHTAGYQGSQITIDHMTSLMRLPKAALRKLHIPSEDSDDISHKYILHSTLKAILSRHVTEIPFSHPKDLLPIFKTLRQYAFLTVILENCFKTPETLGCDDTRLAPDDLETFLLDDTEAPPQSPLVVDLSLAPEHGFGLGVVFPVDQHLVNIMFRIEKNAEVKAILSSAGDYSESLTHKTIENALKSSEDLGLTLEWIRQNLHW